MDKLREKVQNLVAQAKTEAALNLLAETEYLEEHLREELVLLLARYKELKKQTIIGVLSPEQISQSTNQIHYDVIAFIKGLPTEESLLKKKNVILADHLKVSPKKVLTVFESLQKRYSNRLIQKLDVHLTIPLQLSYSQIGTSTKHIETLFEEESKVSNLINNNLSNVLNKNKHLLIVGAPGAGKTTLLLKLALAWINNKEEVSLPIIFNLVSWKKSHSSFQNWLESSLISGFGFSKKFAQKALEKNLILPLLDGFDEIGKNLVSPLERDQLRMNCLTAIDAYISNSNTPHFVLCSRIEEYSKLKIDAPVRAEVLVHDLSWDQITQEFTFINDGSLSNREINVLKKLKSLDKLTQVNFENILATPFYFNITFDSDVFAHSISSLEEIPREKKEIKNYLIKSFIQKKLEHSNKFKYNQSLQYLSWLANWLKKRDAVDFELADFQPSDLAKKRKMWILGSSIYGSAFLLILMFLIGPFEIINGDSDGYRGYGLDYFIVSVLFIVLTFGALLFGLIGKFSKITSIKTEDKRQFEFKRLFKLSTWQGAFVEAKKGGRFGLFFALLFLIPLLTLIGLMIIYEPAFWQDVRTETLQDISNEFSDLENPEDILVTYIGISIFLGLISLFIIVALLGVFFGFIGGVIRNASNISYFNSLISPYYRLTRGLILRTIPLAFLVFFLAFEILFGVNKQYSDVVVMTTVALTSITLFNSPFIKHFILRIGLTYENKTPLRYVRFLNFACEARILEKDGGHWRFRHEILQDFFVKGNLRNENT